MGGACEEQDDTWASECRHPDPFGACKYPSTYQLCDLRPIIKALGIAATSGSSGDPAGSRAQHKECGAQTLVVVVLGWSGGGVLLFSGAGRSQPTQERRPATLPEGLRKGPKKPELTPRVEGA